VRGFALGRALVAPLLLAGFEVETEEHVLLLHDSIDKKHLVTNHCASAKPLLEFYIPENPGALLAEAADESGFLRHARAIRTLELGPVGGVDGGEGEGREAEDNGGFHNVCVGERGGVRGCQCWRVTTISENVDFVLLA
jgi:hypothetical protein